MNRSNGRADIIVIGAGIMGSAIALELSRSGFRVRVLDRGPAAGSGSTSSSSGIIRFHYSTRDGVITAWESKHIWERWPEYLATGDESGYARFHRVGVAVVDAPGSAQRGRVLALFDEIGVPYEEWDAPTLRKRLPAFDAGRYWPPKTVHDEGFWGEAHGEIDAYFTPDAGFVDDPQLAAHNLMLAAIQAGATFSFRSEVTGIPRDAGRARGVLLSGGAVLDAPIVINAAGPYSARVNAMAGVLGEFSTVTTRPLRQEVHVVPGPSGFRLGDGGTVVNDSDLGTYFRPHPGGTILVGGVEPECDPLIWVDDPDAYDPGATVAAWEAQVYRLARRIPSLEVPSRPVGLAALYDVTPDWVPIYDRTSLDGYYVAIGTSGNQFKNAPMVGRLMSALVDACENGLDHDAEPLRVPCEHTGHEVNLGHYSRNRALASTTMSVLG